MAKVELPDGILAIHGRIGNMIYRSRKQPDGTYKVFVHKDPYARKKKMLSSENGPRMDRS